MKNFDINTLIAQAQELNVPQVIAAAGNSKYSFGVVYSKNNGKRISLSKSLAKKLSVDGEGSSIQFLLNPAESVLILGTNLPTNIASSCALCGEDKKIGYAAKIVELLKDTFNLNFNGITSMSFSDIEFDTYDDAPIAIVKMDKC